MMETQKWLGRTKTVGSNIYKNLINNTFMKILKKLYMLLLLVKDLFCNISPRRAIPLFP
jgi:hypothetical protein